MFFQRRSNILFPVQRLLGGLNIIERDSMLFLVKLFHHPMNFVSDTMITFQCRVFTTLMAMQHWNALTRSNCINVTFEPGIATTRLLLCFCRHTIIVAYRVLAEIHLYPICFQWNARPNLLTSFLLQIKIAPTVMDRAIFNII